MPNQTHPRKGEAPSTKTQSPTDALLEKFAETIDSRAEKMNASELKESEKRFNEIADRVVARKRRRETA
jgi:hypothetical protein